MEIFILPFFTEPSEIGMVPSMDTPLLTIAEAVAKTGRSPSTVRRLIHTITETPSHPDRDAVEPDPKQVAALKKKGENFTWRIREGVVMKHFESAPQKEKKSKPAPTGDIFSILQNELELKNRQIEKQWEVIHALNDRLREGNILMGSLQKRLALPEAQSPAEEVVDAPTVKTSAETSKKEAKPAKRRLFAWMKR